MTDQLDYTARIRAKGLDSTGVTEEVARRYHGRRGSHVMLIVEAKIEETSDNADGRHKVALTIQQVEPALDDRLDDHLRGLARSLHHQRRLHSEDEQPQLDGVGDVEPTVEEVLGQGQGLLPESPEDDGWSYPAGEGGQRQEEPVRT